MGGLIVLPGSLFVLHVLKVDDPVDAVTVRLLLLMQVLVIPCFPMLLPLGHRHHVAVKVAETFRDHSLLLFL